MPPGQIVSCQSCGRLLIYGQHCTCGWHPWLKPKGITCLT